MHCGECCTICMTNDWPIGGSLCPLQQLLFDQLGRDLLRGGRTLRHVIQVQGAGNLQSKEERNEGGKRKISEKLRSQRRKLIYHHTLSCLIYRAGITPYYYVLVLNVLSHVISLRLHQNTGTMLSPVVRYSTVLYLLHFLTCIMVSFKDGYVHVHVHCTYY